jgi:alkylation response protein AidB-like acyl-CoA dehydrogenase
MDFGFSAIQIEIRDLARKILSENIDADRHKMLEQRATDGGSAFDDTLWQLLGDAGLFGIALDEDAGGMGLGFTELCILFEEVGRVLAPLPVIDSCLAALTLARSDNDTHRALLQQLASGERIAALALTESSQFDYQQLRCQAQRSADTWSLSGEKACVRYAQHADYLLVSANSPEGTQLFLVSTDASGINSTAVATSSGRPSAHLHFNQTPAIPVGDAQALEFLAQRLMAALCCYQLGCSEVAMNMTAGYVGEREQFGVKIGTFQAVGHRAANCYIDVSCLRLVTLQAVSLLAQEREAGTAVTIAKCWAGDVSHRVSYASQHLHGGFGVDKDYALWRYATHSKETEITLGNSGFLRDQLGAQIAAGHFNIE